MSTNVKHKGILVCNSAIYILREPFEFLLKTTAIFLNGREQRVLGFGVIKLYLGVVFFFFFPTRVAINFFHCFNGYITFHSLKSPHFI